jgi:hypothetical protein
MPVFCIPASPAPNNLPLSKGRSPRAKGARRERCNATQSQNRGKNHLLPSASYSRGAGVPAREKAARASWLAPPLLFPIPARSAPNNLPLSKGRSTRAEGVRRERCVATRAVAQLRKSFGPLSFGASMQADSHARARSAD